MFFSWNANLTATDISVSWLTSTTLKTIIGNNHSDIIMIQPSPFTPDHPCLFSGKLLKDPKSYASVSGCMGDNKTTITLTTALLTVVVDLLLIDGVTYNFDDELPGRKDRESYTPERQRRQIDEI